MKKSVSPVRNTAIGQKAQVRSPESAGMIGRERKPETKPMIAMSNLLDLTSVVGRTIIAL